MNITLPLNKAKKMPIGTVSHGYKKVAEGKWVPVRKDRVKKYMPENQVKSLANEKDIAHSYEMIRAMYRKRPMGQGFEAPVASEADLKVILSRTTISLMSAGRNPEDPEDMKLTDAQIAERQANLKKDLTDLGYVITSTKGHYGLPEDSIMILTHDARRKDMLALGAKYKQDSIILATNGHNEMVYTSGPNKGKPDMVGKGFKMVPDAKDYYTEIQVGSKKVKFTLMFGNIKKALRLILSI